MRPQRVGVGLVLGSALLLAMPAFAADSTEVATTTPIEHFIVLMQENHSFDNYFGSYPGADGIPPDTCMPVDPTDPTNPDCVRPFWLGDRAVQSLGHNQATAEQELRDGQMDGFIWAHRNSGGDGSIAMGYYDDRDLPYYWNVADEYVLFDRFFTSALGGSVWNHMYWVTGTPGNPLKDSIPPGGFGDLPTIFDRLDAKGISWKFYIQNYDPTITYRTREGLGDRGSQVVWAPLLSYDRYLDDPNLFSHIVDLDEYYQDLTDGTLPAVSYIVPSGASEHPPGSIKAGERFVRGLINALVRSDAWDRSAFMWTYDDWGGWYDHVKPPRVDEYGYGFRAPALLVSPYAKRGEVDHTTLDFTSMLKFIEENWDLEPLAQRDAEANGLSTAFDFEQPPRRPAFLTAERARDVRPEPNRLVLYVAYAAAAGIAAVLILRAEGDIPKLVGRWLRRMRPIGSPR
jgi:phospholipase C